MQGIFLQGQSILNKEIEHAKNIPENNRIFYKNHIVNEEGEGEPHGPNQEIIIEQHNIKSQKVRKLQKLENNPTRGSIKLETQNNTMVSQLNASRELLSVSFDDSIVLN